MKTITYDVVATKTATVDDKIKFINQFKAFVKSGYNWNKFTKDFYNRLTVCFFFCAQYNQYGFYKYYFDSGKDAIADFESHILNSNVFGDPNCTFYDAEKIIQNWFRDYKANE